MKNIDDLSAVLTDLQILEHYSRKIPGLIDEYKKALQKKGWTAYTPFTDGVTLKYGISKSQLLQEYDQFLCETCGLYFEFSRVLKENLSEQYSNKKIKHTQR